MKHYLNTELKGKIGADGNSYYPVYITFSVNSQTYKYRSQLVRRPLTIDEYAELENMYRENGLPSTILKKERQIIVDIIKESFVNGKFIQSEFKTKFIQSCTSILDVLNQINISLPITKWNRSSLSAELFAMPDLDSIDNSYNLNQGFDRFIHYQLTASAIKYHAIKNEKDDINGLMLAHDWFDINCSLKEDFIQFIGHEHDRSMRNSILEYLEIILNL